MYLWTINGLEGWSWWWPWQFIKPSLSWSASLTISSSSLKRKTLKTESLPTFQLDNYEFLSKKPKILMSLQFRICFSIQYLQCKISLKSFNFSYLCSSVFARFFWEKIQIFIPSHFNFLKVFSGLVCVPLIQPIKRLYFASSLAATLHWVHWVQYYTVSVTG